MPPLNARLYQQLKATFGRVLIASEGVPFVGTVRSDRFNTSVFKKVVVNQSGEHYRVCCPFCKDTRHRLYINHVWGEIYKGQQMYHMAHCFNEDCLSKSNNRNRLIQMVHDKKVVIPAGVSASDHVEPEVSEPEGSFLTLDQLPASHAAIRYLIEKRKFDIPTLLENWGIRWYLHSPVLPPSNRLFFPLYEQEGNEVKMRGGQAHWLDPTTLEGTPPKKSGEVKWYTIRGTKVSKHLYNSHNARKQKDIVVITEGPFDAIRVGPEYGVALFGHTVSYDQRKILWDCWGSKGAMGVLALDPDMDNDPGVLELERWMRSRWKHFVRVKTPDNKDISDFTRGEAWQMIGGAIKNA